VLDDFSGAAIVSRAHIRQIWVGQRRTTRSARDQSAAVPASRLSPRLMTGGHPAPALAELAQVHSYTTAFWWAAGMFATGSVLAALLFRRGAPAAPGAEEAQTK
jgi:hypothetical protein